MPPKRTTSLDLARAAGVNQSTVSRALAGDLGVSDDVRAHIHTLARQMNYAPNAWARSMVTQRSNIVGFIVAGITSPFQSYVLERFIGALHTTGRQALVFNVGRGERVEDVLPLALGYQVEALVVTSAPLRSDALAATARKTRQLILFNRTMDDAVGHSISCDNESAAAGIAAHLLARGRRRFAFVAGNPHTSTNLDRQRGFLARLGEAGFGCDVIAADYTYDAGHAAAQRLLDAPASTRADAVFCASDIIALGVMDALRERGLRVPHDVAVAGFDDIPMAGWGAYQLTTMRQPIDAMIAATLKLIETPPARGTHTLQLPAELIVRASTSP